MRTYPTCAGARAVPKRRRESATQIRSARSAATIAILRRDLPLFVKLGLFGPADDQYRAVDRGRSSVARAATTAGVMRVMSLYLDGVLAGFLAPVADLAPDRKTRSAPGRSFGVRSATRVRGRAWTILPQGVQAGRATRHCEFTTSNIRHVVARPPSTVKI